jgi:hypothetical protein
MRFRGMLGNFVLVLLTAQLLFLSAGIHNAASHIPVCRSMEQPSQERFSSSSNLKDPVSHHCSICFFQQLLSHCVFPEHLKAVVTELSHPQAFAFPQTTSFPSLGRKVNRSPPMSASLL